MLEVFDAARIAAAGPRTLSDLLEQGNIIYFPQCPVPLPPERDLEALRNGLPGQLTRKNVSYHPEADSVRGIPHGSPVYETAYRTLTNVRRDIAEFTRRVMPELMRNAPVATCRVAPLAKVLDSSPYDRAMKRFHDFMKDTPQFQQDPEGHAEVHFAPYSAWTVFADGVSHGCLSGQHCFIWTALTPLVNARYPELAPLNVLRAAA